VDYERHCGRLKIFGKSVQWDVAKNKDAYFNVTTSQILEFNMGHLNKLPGPNIVLLRKNVNFDVEIPSGKAAAQYLTNNKSS
jgi:hypothetical protein